MIAFVMALMLGLGQTAPSLETTEAAAVLDRMHAAASTAERCSRSHIAGTSPKVLPA